MSLVKYPLTLLKKDITELEYNAKAQYKFNRAATVFWLCNMPLVVVLDAHFYKWWIQISVMYLVQVSLWALVATHFGAMSAALAADNNGSTIKAVAENVADISDDVDDIHAGIIPESPVEPALDGHPEVWALPVASK